MINGEGKYFLNCIHFDIHEKMEKNNQKKIYKDEIKSIIQHFIDKKINKISDRKTNGEGLFSSNKAKPIVIAPNTNNANNNMSKIMEMIEKGKANLKKDKQFSSNNKDEFDRSK